MNPGADTNRDPPNPWKWVLACALVLGLQAVWFFGLSPGQWVQPQETRPHRPAWRQVALPEDRTEADWARRLHLWSPILFALPATEGFSGAWRQQEIALRPPVHRPADTAMVLERRAGHSGTDPAVSLPSWMALRAEAEAFPLHHTLPEPEAGRAWSSVSEAPVIERIERDQDRGVEQMDWPEGRDVWGDRSWIAELALQVNEQGVVTHALLEQSTPDPEVNARLVRVAHRWRWVPSKEGIQLIRLHVSYVGPARDPAGEME